MDESEPHELLSGAFLNEAEQIPKDTGCLSVSGETMSTGQLLEDVADSTISSVGGSVVLASLSDSDATQPEDIAELDDLKTRDEQDTSMEGLQENVATMFTEKHTFLQEIHSQFLLCVDPVESDIMDHLRSFGAISESEEEDVRTEKTRKDKARKLWDILHRVPPQLFGEKCVPKLRSLYPHVMRGVDFCCDQTSDPCLRHILAKYMTTKKLADILLSTKCCSADEYRELLEHKRPVQEQWEMVFQKLKKHCNDADLQETLLKLMTDRDVGKPQNFKKQLRSGCPCVCHLPRLKQEQSTKNKHVAIRQASESSVTGYPNTSGSSEHMAFTDSESLDTSEQQSSSLRSHAPAVSQDDDVSYNNTVHRINLALVDAAQCKLNFRKLQAIQHQVKSQKAAPARESTITITIQCGDDLSDLTALSNEAFSIMKNTKILLQRCQSLIADTAQSHVIRPFPQRHILENETREAVFFYKQMESMDVITEWKGRQFEPLRAEWEKYYYFFDLLQSLHLNPQSSFFPRRSQSSPTPSLLQKKAAAADKHNNNKNNIDDL